MDRSEGATAIFCLDVALRVVYKPLTNMYLARGEHMAKTRATKKVRSLYSSESHLVEEFCNALESPDCPWGKVHHAKEFGYLRGRTDVIAVGSSDEVIAFELKLVDWPKALEQAYRNTCFAHGSYVVLPQPIVNRAEHHRVDFERRKVGMCYIENGEILIAVPSTTQRPIQPWLSRLAAARAREGQGPCL